MLAAWLLIVTLSKTLIEEMNILHHNMVPDWNCADYGRLQIVGTRFGNLPSDWVGLGSDTPKISCVWKTLETA